MLYSAAYIDMWCRIVAVKKVKVILWHYTSSGHMGTSCKSKMIYIPFLKWSCDAESIWKGKQIKHVQGVDIYHEGYNLNQLNTGVLKQMLTLFRQNEF